MSQRCQDQAHRSLHNFLYCAPAWAIQANRKLCSFRGCTTYLLQLMMFDERLAILAVAKLGAVEVILSNAEYLAAPRHLKDDGLMSWEVGRLRHAYLIRDPLGAWLHAALAYPNVLWLLTARMLLGLVLLLGSVNVLNPWPIWGITVLTGLFLIRNGYGLDGADQMVWILFFGLGLMMAVGTDTAQRAYLWFLA